jgi:hypothetical protein
MEESRDEAKKLFGLRGGAGEGRNRTQKSTPQKKMFVAVLEQDVMHSRNGTGGEA